MGATMVGDTKDVESPQGVMHLQQLWTVRGGIGDVLLSKVGPMTFNA